MVLKYRLFHRKFILCERYLLIFMCASPVLSVLCSLLVMSFTWSSILFCDWWCSLNINASKFAIGWSCDLCENWNESHEFKMFHVYRRTLCKTLRTTPRRQYDPLPRISWTLLSTLRICLWCLIMMAVWKLIFREDINILHSKNWYPFVLFHVEVACYVIKTVLTPNL